MKISILGASGTIGRAAAAAFRERGETVRAVGRSEEKLRRAYPAASGAEIVPADVTTRKGCARAVAGSDAVLYSLGLPYTAKAFAAYPGMMRLAVEAARAEGVRKLLLVGNVYSYGRPRAARVREDHPRDPHSQKGKWRKEQEDVVLAAHGAGGLQTLVLRFPDFYGPFAGASLGNMILSATASGKRADLLGPIDTPHEFLFTPDTGPVIADLIAGETGWGEACNLGGAGIITLREFARAGFAAAGEKPRFRVAGPGMVRLLGLFSPLMRELVEMSYLLTDPVLLDDGKLHAILGTVRKTPYEEGIRRTIEHLRKEDTGS